MVLILGIMLVMGGGIQVSVFAMPIWLALMWVCYQLKSKRVAAEAALAK